MLFCRKDIARYCWIIGCCFEISDAGSLKLRNFGVKANFYGFALQILPPIVQFLYPTGDALLSHSCYYADQQ
jgi:hypothetical protein